MNQTRTIKLHGFTIVETIIFIFLLSILLAGFMDFSYLMTRRDIDLIDQIQDVQSQ